MKLRSLLGRLLAGFRELTGTLTPRADWIEEFRIKPLRLAHPVLNRLGRPTIRRKGSADYVCTVPISAESLENVL